MPAIVALLLLAVAMVNAGPHRLQTRSTHQLCGRALVDMMSLVCGGNYASPLGKRSSTLLDRFTTKLSNKFDANAAADWNQNNAGEDYPHVGEEVTDLMDVKVNSYGIYNTKRAEEEVFYRKVRGIVEECCHKPCSFGQMQQYCGERPGKRASELP